MWARAVVVAWAAVPAAVRDPGEAVRAAVRDQDPGADPEGAEQHPDLDAAQEVWDRDQDLQEKGKARTCASA